MYLVCTYLLTKMVDGTHCLILCIDHVSESKNSNLAKMLIVVFLSRDSCLS